MTGGTRSGPERAQVVLDCAGKRLTLHSPVVAASGCAAYGKELSRFFELSALGAIITKSIMLEPRAGRPPPRMAETVGGMINAIGLQGCGIEEFVAVHLPWLAGQDARIGVSLAGKTAAEYRLLADKICATELASFLELNISCPNVDQRGQMFAGDPRMAAEVVAAVAEVVGREVPIFVKLAADVTDLVAVAEACVDAGAGGLSLINTLSAGAIDPRTLRPAIPGLTGGLSGPAIHPVAVRCVYQVHSALPDVPILGGGGVFSGRDALSLIAAGASAVTVGTATFRDPAAALRIADELSELVAGHGFLSIREAVGVAHRPAGVGGSRWRAGAHAAP